MWTDREAVVEVIMARDRSSEIHWEEWSDEAFERARMEEKLVLLSIGACWCHWCHVLDRSSYSDPQVVELINDRYVPIRVEADRRPDIQDRYLMGGWPTTAVLTPDARILTGSTYMPPERMLNLLRQVDRLYQEDKAAVTLRVSRMSEEAEAQVDRHWGAASTKANHTWTPAFPTVRASTPSSHLYRSSAPS